LTVTGPFTPRGGIVDNLAQHFHGVKDFGDGIKLATGDTLSIYTAWTTFAPNLVRTSGAGTLTSANLEHARYMRIGNIVTISIYYNTITVATDTVNLGLTLPVAPLRVMRGIYANRRVSLTDTITLCGHDATSDLTIGALFPVAADSFFWLNYSYEV
jgi:hypothetical protein